MSTYLLEISLLDLKNNATSKNVNTVPVYSLHTANTLLHFSDDVSR